MAQQNTIILENNLKITFIYHSGFAVETLDCTLLFDYYRGDFPEFAAEKPLYVFSSHKHADHFNFQIFDLAEKYKEIHYILSEDIRKKYKRKYLLEKKGLTEELLEKIIWIKEKENREDQFVQIQSIPSTDIGVAFLVRLRKNGSYVYHAGDLNWWTWKGETEEEKQKMEKNFKDDLEFLCEKLAGNEITAAFLPLDPRLENHYADGFDYYMHNIPIRYAFPMHAFGDYSVIGRLMKEDIACEYRNKVINLCGEKKKKVKILNPEVRRRIKEMLERKEET